MSDSEFREAIIRLDEAVSAGWAALVAEPGYPRVRVEIFDPGAAGLDDPGDVAAGRVTELARESGLLWLFAFEDAPDEAIKSWYDDDTDQTAVDQVLRRVALVRSNMPALEALWDARRDSLLPVIQEIRYEVSEVIGALPFAVVRIASSGGDDRPGGGMLPSLVVRTFLPDLRHLISVLKGVERDLEKRTRGIAS